MGTNMGETNLMDGIRHGTLQKLIMLINESVDSDGRKPHFRHWEGYVHRGREKRGGKGRGEKEEKAINDLLFLPESKNLLLHRRKYTHT